MHYEPKTIKELADHLLHLITMSAINPPPNRREIIETIGKIKKATDSDDDTNLEAKKIMGRLEIEAIDQLGDGAWAETEILEQDDVCYDILLNYGVDNKMYTEQYKLYKESLKLFDT